MFFKVHFILNFMRERETDGQRETDGVGAVEGRGIRALGAGVIDCCELLTLVLGTE